MSAPKPDPSSPVSLADIAYALDHLAQDVPAHVDSRAAEALEEIERLLWVFERFQSSATPTGAKIHQILGAVAPARELFELAVLKVAHTETEHR